MFHLSLYQRKHLQSKRLRSLEAQLTTAEKSSFRGDAQQVHSHCLRIYLEHQPLVGFGSSMGGSLSDHLVWALLFAWVRMNRFYQRHDWV